MGRQRPPDHHGMRGLVDHFITANITRNRVRRNGFRYHRQFGRRMLRETISVCELCQAAEARDARLHHLRTAYRQRNR